jgi:hypothetical protein
MLAQRSIGCLSLWTLFKLVLLPEEHHLISCSTLCTPRRHWAHALRLRPCHLAPHPSRFLLLCLPKKLKDDRIEDVGGAEWRWCRRGMLELNASTSDGRWSRRQKCHMLLIGWCVSLERIGRWRQQMDCVQAYVFRPMEGYNVHITLKIICWIIWTLFDALRAIISCFIVDGSYSQPLIR